MTTDNRPLLGIMLMVGFAVVAPMIDVFAKLAGQNLPVAQLTAARFLIQSALLLPLAWALGMLHRPARAEIGLHVVRACLIMLGTAFFFLALRVMPIADAISIFFVEPFIATFLSAYLLKESVGWRRVLACLIGFSGALFVIQPSFQNFGLPALFPLATAGFFAFYLILTRKMAREMHPITLQAYTGLTAVSICVPILLIFDNGPFRELDTIMPDQRNLLFLFGLGLAATVSHVFISYALKFAPTGVVAPMQYLEIVMAAVMGYLIFDDILNGAALLGVCIIVLSGLYVLHRERLDERLTRSIPPQP